MIHNDMTVLNGKFGFVSVSPLVGCNWEEDLDLRPYVRRNRIIVRPADVRWEQVGKSDTWRSDVPDLQFPRARTGSLRWIRFLYRLDWGIQYLVTLWDPSNVIT